MCMGNERDDEITWILFSDMILLPSVFLTCYLSRWYESHLCVEISNSLPKTQDGSSHAQAVEPLIKLHGLQLAHIYPRLSNNVSLSNILDCPSALLQQTNFHSEWLVLLWKGIIIAVHQQQRPQQYRFNWHRR